MRKNGYFTPNRDHGYNVLRAQVELKQWQEANDELAPAKFRFRAYEKCFFNRIRQKSPILYRWVMNAVRYEGYRW